MPTAADVTELADRHSAERELYLRWWLLMLLSLTCPRGIHLDRC